MIKLWGLWIIIVLSVMSLPVKALENRSLKMENEQMSMQVVLTAQQGRGGELAMIMLKAAEVVSKIKDCHLYLVQMSATDESKVLITEVWESQSAHRASLANSDVLALIAKAKPLIQNMQHEIGTPLNRF